MDSQPTESVDLSGSSVSVVPRPPTQSIDVKPIAPIAAPQLDTKTPERPVKNAVILGGGPGGLATAIMLAKEGVHVTILEVRDEHYARPHHLNARQATIDTLATYGVEKEVRERSGWDPTVALPGDPNRASSDPKEMMDSPSVGQVRISDVEIPLYNEAVKLGVEYFHHSIGVLTPPPTDGPNKGMYHLTAREAEQDDGKFSPVGSSTDLGYPDLIIAADGANSPTRKDLGIAFDATSEGKPYLGGLVNKSIGPQYKKMIVQENGYPVHIMATGHAIYPQTWVSAEVDPLHANMTPEQRIDYLCEEASLVTGQEVKPEDIAWGGGQVTTVQNRQAQSAVAGSNVVLVGDAARTGSVWQSGGLNLALTTDVADVVNLVKDINSGKASRSEALNAYNQATLEATRCWHEAGAGELGGPPTPPAATARIQ